MIQRVVSGSFIYRWLTAKPEPEVIVIDLRETWTVGPVIELIDRLLEELTQSAQTSTLMSGVHNGVTAFQERPVNVVSFGVIASALGVLLVGGLTQSLSIVSTVVAILMALVGLFGLGSQRTLRDIQETKAVQLIISAFEPPEPPSSTNTETTDSHRETAEDDVDSNEADTE
ncbi:hypothetical protein [Halohasta litorea]|uniref:Uncharacterized protein n=1 Tax=Halohasta litorea TaxID=869891 RepID=A0ABD6D4I5_9EURY|nr:hypothetical protein [Halohasta litorea]